MTEDSKNPWSTSQFWDEKFRDQTTPWDLEGPNPTLIRLVQESNLARGSSMLIPGCGKGHEVLYFSELGYNVSAVDWSKTAVDDLRVLARRKELTLEILRESFWNLPPSWFGTFDVVLEQTFLCAIDPEDKEKYVDYVTRLLRPGGVFLGALFVTPKKEHVSVFGDGNPPFWSEESEIKTLFGKDFEIDHFQPSKAPTEKFSKMEWEARFFKKRS